MYTKSLSWKHNLKLYLIYIFKSNIKNNRYWIIKVRKPHNWKVWLQSIRNWLRNFNNWRIIWILTMVERLLSLIRWNIVISCMKWSRLINVQNWHLILWRCWQSIQRICIFFLIHFPNPNRLYGNISANLRLLRIGFELGQLCLDLGLWYLLFFYFIIPFYGLMRRNLSHIHYK